MLSKGLAAMDQSPLAGVRGAGIIIDY